MVGGSVVQEKLAKLPDGHTSDRAKSLLVEGVQNEAGDIVLGRIDEGTTDNFFQDQVGKSAFSRDSLSFRSCRNAGQLVARLFLIGFGKQLAEIGEVESLDHGILPVRRDHVNEKVGRY